METADHSHRITLDELYDGYVEACDELRIEPLAPYDLWALVQALADRDTATLH